jgi:hypothetical protein
MRKSKDVRSEEFEKGGGERQWWGKGRNVD